MIEAWHIVTTSLRWDSPFVEKLLEWSDAALTVKIQDCIFKQGQ